MMGVHLTSDVDFKIKFNIFATFLFQNYFFCYDKLHAFRGELTDSLAITKTLGLNDMSVRIQALARRKVGRELRAEQ